MIRIIVARAQNGVIGSNNDLPWNLPADLKHFKQLTAGHSVIMGRKTYQSIYDRLKKPLPERRNIVISKSMHSLPKGFELADSLGSAIQLADNDAFIIGGATIYNVSLAQNLVDEIYVTEVKAEVKGDTYFPDLYLSNWQETDRESRSRDEQNRYDYDFVTYARRRR